MIPSRRRRLGLSALATAGLAVALVGSPTLVAAGSPGISIALGDPCIFGANVIKGATITLTLKRGGDVIARSVFKTTGFDFLRCLAKAPKGGDTLVFKQVKNGVTSVNRWIPVPVMLVTLDAATDVITGSVTVNGAPVVGEPVLLELIDRIGVRADQGPAYSLDLDSNGQVFADATGDLDIGPGTLGSLRWYPANVDFMYSATALPAAAMFTGKATVHVTGRLGAKTKLTLKTSGGTVRATATITTKADEGDPIGIGTFKNGSTTVKPKVGDKITSSRLPGSWTVVANTFSVTSGLGDGAASVTCPENVEAIVWIDGGRSGSDFFPTGEVTFSGLNIDPGVPVEVACQDANGFAQWFSKVAP